MTTTIDISKDARECDPAEFAREPARMGTTEFPRSYAHGWEGPEAIVAALAAVERDEIAVARFIVAEHHRHGDAVSDYVAVAKGEDGSWRYCGAGDHPEREGSHRLAGDMLEAVAKLTFALARKGGTLPSRPHIFRVP